MTKINNQGFDLGCFFVVLCAVTGKPEKIGSILNGVDDDFSTPFFVFAKYLRNAIK